MCPKIFFLYRGIVAFIAFVHFLSRVIFQMFLQMVCLNRCIVALIAFVRFQFSFFSKNFLIRSVHCEMMQRWLTFVFLKWFIYLSQTFTFHRDFHLFDLITSPCRNMSRIRIFCWWIYYYHDRWLMNMTMMMILRLVWDKISPAPGGHSGGSGQYGAGGIRRPLADFSQCQYQSDE